MPTESGRVTRFDPVNRTLLGQFGPSLEPSQIFSSSAGIWVLNSTGRYARYNYSTGELLNQSSVTPNFTTNAIAGTTSNNLIGLVSNQLREFNMLTGTSSTIANLNSSFTYSQIERMSNGVFVVMGKNNSNLAMIVETYNGSGQLIDSFQYGTGIIQDTVGQITITGSGLAYRAHACVGAGGGAPASQLRSFNISGTGLITGATTSSLLGIGWNSDAPLVTVAGHDGLWVVGKAPTTSQTRVMQLSLSPNIGILDYYDVNHTLPSTGRWNMVNVVAPEPASFLGLCLPLAWLAKRKKKA